MNCNNLVCKLKERKLTISFMESCTGGALCDFVTDVENCSSVFIGGYITYTNEQKVKCGVPRDVINKYGVYSEECAIAMAIACMNNTGSNISVGVTGTLGNIDKNNSDSEIGKVYVCIMNDTGKKEVQTLKVNKYILDCSRNIQKENVVFDVLDMIDSFLEEQ